MSRAERLLLFAATMLAAIPSLKPAGALNPATSTVVAAIDAEQTTDQQRSRILTGISAEGTLVEAYGAHGQIHKIVVEALEERGRRLSTYYLDDGALLRAHEVDVSYNELNLARVPSHKHLEIAAGDSILADVTYDLKPLSRHVASPTCNSAICSFTADDLAARAAMFLRLMNTNSAAGDDGEWACVPDPVRICADFTHDDD